MTVEAKPRILIALNAAWNVFNFRAGLIRALQREGFEVVVATPSDGWEHRVEALGCAWWPLDMQAHGTNPLEDALLGLRCRRLLQRLRPAVVLSFTIKPNIYMALAGRSLGIPVIANIAGLGALFISPTWATRVARWLYRLALAKSSTVFFQNPDDRELFVSHRLVRADAAQLLPGSGVDLQHFKPEQPDMQEASAASPFVFLFIGRLLRDKGVGELVQAAQQLKAQGRHFVVLLLGSADSRNPSGISLDQIHQWQSDGLIRHLPHMEDPRPVINQSHAVVLPSYREGTPRSLLEAAAMAKPLITTDVPGCREVVQHGLNGLLCRVQDADDLARAMGQMMNMKPSERNAMGQAGRRKMELEFDEATVAAQYVRAIQNELAAAGGPSADRTRVI